MEKQKAMRNLYLRAPAEIASHLEMMARKWNVSKNGYVNKLLREDLEREIQLSTDFFERVHEKIRS